MRMAFLERELLGAQKMRMNRESLTVPKDFADIIRQCGTPECFITLGPRRLMLFPLGSWRDYQEQMKTSDKPEVRKLLHQQKMYGSKLTELDASARIKIPQLLFNFIQEPDEVWVVGMEDFLEIYTIEEYEKRFKEIDLSDSVNPEDIL